MKLYPGVADSLRKLRDAKCLLVGYTESPAYYTSYRFRKPALDQTFDYLYSPADHDLPINMTQEQIRMYPPEHYQFGRTVHRYTPAGETKPSPKVLNQILNDLRVSPPDAIYVGDSRMKDLAMAQAVGVLDVWAKYGTAQTRPEYELLRKVTHWTPAQVQKEKHLRDDEVIPSHTLATSFSELLDLDIEFLPFQK